MQGAGEQAAYQAGVHGLRPELIKMLGRLKYRTSYGQNVLAHSHRGRLPGRHDGRRTGHRRQRWPSAPGFLHDIGKAVDREVEGSHAAIGADLVKQWDKTPEVVKAIAEHHYDEHRDIASGASSSPPPTPSAAPAPAPAASPWRTTSSA